MKKSFSLLPLVLLAAALQAQNGYSIVSSYQIGPGCRYYRYSNPSLPMQIYVTTMDLSNPYITLESAASQDRLTGFETTSSLSLRTSTENHQAVCGVNGDFYDTGNGVPLSPCVVNGEFTHTPFVYRNGFACREDGKGVILNPVFTGTLISPKDNAHYAVANVNLSRGADEICLYNDFFGTSTKTGGDGTECLISPLTGWVVNDTVLCLVEACDTVSNNRTIPANKSVLSGEGAGAFFLRSHAREGDTLKIVQSFPTEVKRITQFMGGACKMMADGVNVAEESGIAERVWSDYLTGRNPRTVIGFNGDSTLVYFVVVDGRQAGFSIGMGMHELVDFMSAIGVRNAVNLDGGGSSAMIVRGACVNSPSDGGERAVANSVLCYSSAPTG
ncbi:MAG: phosphodiester glycosidase family protein, partial [Candidatus Marinimicrobia bacterium]|nr:phosphodiester glycosidase family protein [Candidatus Neomarinimicrobiota bacterium]